MVAVKGNSSSGFGKEKDGNDRNHYEKRVQAALVKLVINEDLKIEYLAFICHTSHQAIGKYLSGASPIPLHIAALIDNAMGKPVFFTLYASMVGRRV